MSLRTSLFACCLAVVPVVASAESDSRQAASSGRAAWAAFECHALANIIGDSTASERLFIHGLAQGRQFLKDMQAGRINSSDIRSEVPMGVLDSLSGPSNDFILGRIFESATQVAFHDFNAVILDKYMDERRAFAQAKFTQSNCRLIGR